MRRWLGSGALALLLFAAAGARAETLRDFCGDRPGLSTPACIVDRGHLQAELGLADWTLDRQPDTREDTVLAGDLLLRYGLTRHTEVRLGWTAYGHDRVRDRLSGEIDAAGRTGDVTIGLKQNFAHPDESKLSVGLLPYVTLPVGRRPIGAGSWGAGMLLPLEWEFVHGVRLELTPRAEARPNEAGRGRHLAYSNVAGIEWDITRTLSIDVEFQETRDRAPGAHETEKLGGVSFDYTWAERVQFDVGTIYALNRNAPDLELYFGISRKF